MDKLVKNKNRTLFGSRGLVNGYLGMVPLRHYLPDGLKKTIAVVNNLTFMGCSEESIVGGGLNFDEENSEGAALGELIERINGASMYKYELLYNSAAELKKQGQRVFPIEQVKYYADWQFIEGFPYRKITDEDKVYWIKGRCFYSEEEIYIPTYLVFWSHSVDSFYVQGTTTGLAAHITKGKAIENGFFECIERHAFSDFWYNQNTKKRIKYNVGEVIEYYKGEYELTKMLDNPSIKIALYDLSANLPAKVFLVMFFFTYKERELFAVGASSRFDRLNAIKGACREAYLAIDYAIQVIERYGWGKFSPDVLNDIDDFSKHFAFYNVFDEMRPKIEIFEEAKSDVTGFEKFGEDEIGKINSLKSPDLKSEVKDFFYVDLTDEESSSIGYSVTRTILPGFTLLSGSHNAPFLGSKIFSDKNSLCLELPHFFP